MKEWITTREAARRWGLNDSTLRRAIMEGRIRPDECMKPGRDWLIKVSAVERLYGKPRRFSKSDINRIEAILRVENLGIDYEAFESGDELADYLDGRRFPGFDEPMQVSQEQREALREIYEQRKPRE